MEPRIDEPRRLGRRTFLAVAGGMVGTTVGLAGCTGGGSGDGTTTNTTVVGGSTGGSGGAGGDGGVGGGSSGASGSGGGSGAGDDGGGAGEYGSGGGGGSSSGPFEPFAKTGVYTYDIAGGENPEEGMSGTITFDVTEVTDETAAITLTYDVEIAPGEVEQGVGGHFEGERQASGPKETVLFPLSQFPGGSVIVFAFYPVTYAAGQELAVGQEWSSAGPTGQTLSSSVTGTDRYAGVPCYTTEMKRADGAVVHESCIAPDHGLVAYSAFYNVDEEFATVRLELTGYSG